MHCVDTVGTSVHLPSSSYSSCTLNALSIYTVCSAASITHNSYTKGELSRRHDAVVDAVSRVARQVGAQVGTEVKGLDLRSEKRPDLQIVFPGRMILSDVAVSHML